MNISSQIARRLVRFGFLGFLTLLLVACGAGGSASSPGPGGNQPPPAQTSAPTPTVATGTITEFPNKQVGEPIVFGSDGNLWYPSKDIGRMTPNGTSTEFQVPTFPSDIRAMTLGPDGNIWFTETSPNKIGVITPVGKVTEYPLPANANQPASGVSNIASGPDGNLWFRENARDLIGRITTNGVITEFPVSSGTFSTRGLVVAPDGNIWFTNQTTVNKMTPDGHVTTYPLPSSMESTFAEMTLGPDKAVWFINGNPGVVRIAPDGTMTSFNIPRTYDPVTTFVTGPDGNLWMGNGNDVVRMTMKGEFTRYPLPNNEKISALVAGKGGLWYYDDNNYVIGFVAIAKA